MENYEINQIFSDAKPIEELEEIPETIDLAGYQVTRAELFSHTREPAITIWDTRIKFNMACLKRFPGVTHIQLLINSEEKRLIIRPCDPDAPDALRWAKGGGEKELTNRDLLCRVFSAKIFDLMGWDHQYRYKMLGKPAVYRDEMLYLFKLSDFELFVSGKKGKNAYLPGEWREYFGTPALQHEDSYKINLADGYVTTDQV